jgi:pantothenate kinase
VVTTTYTSNHLAGLLKELANQLNRRVIVGIAGSPGSGKSTLALQLHRHLGSSSAVVPMDGFHLSQQQLVSQGKADRKGAPDTFDVEGFLHTLTRVRDGKEDVYIPEFDRSQENPIAASILISTETKIIIVEGNYLLLSQPRWNQVESFLDVRWFLMPPLDLRLDRLVHRHMSHGKNQAEAKSWALDVDQINANLIELDIQRADLVINVLVG